MKLAPLPMHATLELMNVAPHEIGTWIATFTFYCGDEEYDAFISVGKNSLTERQVNAIIERRGYLAEARRQFLENVPLKTIH